MLCPLAGSGEIFVDVVHQRSDILSYRLVGHEDHDGTVMLHAMANERLASKKACECEVESPCLVRSIKNRLYDEMYY